MPQKGGVDSAQRVGDPFLPTQKDEEQELNKRPQQQSHKFEKASIFCLLHQLHSWEMGSDPVLCPGEYRTA